MATRIPVTNGKKQEEPSLSYDGKDLHFDPNRMPRANLEAVFRIGNIDTGRLILGENSRVLAALLSDTSIRNKVDLIYIDPPFATSGMFSCKEQRAAYSDILVGPEYLEFLRTRLILCRELMSSHSSIFVHIDERYLFHIKLLMDEIFGAQMYRNMIVRRKCNSKNYTTRRLGNIVDYILWYSKTREYIWHTPHSPLTEDFVEREYPYLESETGRRYKRVPLHAPGIRRGETGNIWKGLSPPKGKHWQYKPQTLDEMDKRGEIYWSRNGNPRRKVYLDQSSGFALQDLWTDVKDAHNQNCSITGYPTEKNPKLLERLVMAASNPGSITLDFFGGSGTLAEAAAQHERRWISVDRSELAIWKSLERLVKGKRLMGNYVTDFFNEKAFSGGSVANWSLWVDLEDVGFATAASMKHWLKNHSSSPAILPSTRESRG